MPPGYDGPAPVAESEGLDFYDIQEAMSAHFKAHLSEIRTWSWRIFCDKWCRLLKYAAEEQARKDQQR